MGRQLGPFSIFTFSIKCSFCGGGIECLPVSLPPHSGPSDRPLDNELIYSLIFIGRLLYSHIHTLPSVGEWLGIFGKLLPFEMEI